MTAPEYQPVLTGPGASALERARAHVLSACLALTEASERAADPELKVSLAGDADEMEAFARHLQERISAASALRVGGAS